MLVVDDDVVIRNVLRAVLERDGRFGTIEVAEGGYDAIDMAYEMHPAIIVLDLAMWELSGFEALPALHSRHPAAKIVIYTASYDERLRAEGMSRGAADVVSKTTPVVDVPNRLLAVLR